MRRLFPLFALASAASPAAALEVKPLAEARLRHEHVDQAGIAQNANALTIRTRAGAVATEGAVSALIEAQGNLAILGDYDDGLSGPQARPLVADPQNVAISRAQLQYRGGPLVLTAGRQRIALEDERFVGAIGFRQNGQTFDAVRAEITPAKGVKADISYVWRVRTIWGVDGNGARPVSLAGDTVLANLSWASPIGTLSGFAYLVEQGQVPALSSQTWGLRLAGSRAVGAAKIGWQFSHARQSGHANNPNDQAARYWLADVSADLGGPRLGLGYEVLGADDGRPFTSFQTPLGTNFKFQGWADKFLTTPADGVRDLYASAGWGWKAVGPAKAVSVQAMWHRFESDRLVRRYGDEIDLLASARFGRTTASVRYADYRAAGFATDTQKLWLQLDWTI